MKKIEKVFIDFSSALVLSFSVPCFDVTNLDRLVCENPDPGWWKSPSTPKEFYSSTKFLSLSVSCFPCFTLLKEMDFFLAEISFRVESVVHALVWQERVHLPSYIKCIEEVCGWRTSQPFEIGRKKSTEFISRSSTWNGNRLRKRD